MTADNQMLTQAIAFAGKAHFGQKDKSGKDYIGHPQRVMDTVAANDEKITAILHDVVEDTPYSLEDLREALHLPERILQAIAVLTRKPGEDYMIYIRRLSQNELAAAVKQADLKDNMDLTRLPVITQKDLERQEKYQRASEFLQCHTKDKIVI